MTRSKGWLPKWGSSVILNCHFGSAISSCARRHLEREVFLRVWLARMVDVAYQFKWSRSLVKPVGKSFGKHREKFQENDELLGELWLQFHVSNCLWQIQPQVWLKKGCSSYFISSSPIYHLLTEDQPSTGRALTRYCTFQLDLLVLASLILSRFQFPGSSFFL